MKASSPRRHHEVTLQREWVRSRSEKQVLARAFDLAIGATITGRTQAEPASIERDPPPVPSPPSPGVSSS
jgi:hypothetical protein